MKEDVLNAVLNYVETDHTGALLINGKWGCGKTYYITHNIFDELREKGKKPIIISLFGMNSLEELPKKISSSILTNEVGIEQTEQIQNSSQIFQSIASKIPIIKDIVDVATSCDWASLLLDEETKRDSVIFLDDLERLVDKIDVNEILGVVNDLVENKRLKVILVANESFLKEREGEETEDSTSNKPSKLIFKEKVIEKTVSFEPEILSIFEELVREKKNDDFTKIMLTESIKDIINPDHVSKIEFTTNKSDEQKVDESEALKSNLHNIRILKFAIEHFYQIYCTLKASEDFDLWEKDYTATYLWAAVVGYSIEYKMNNIEYGNYRDLDDYLKYGSVSIVWYKNEADEFAPDFYQKYFTRHYLIPFFSEDLFNYITTWKHIDVTKVRNALYPIVCPVEELDTDVALLHRTNHDWDMLTSAELDQRVRVILDSFLNGEFKVLKDYFDCYEFLNCYIDFVYFIVPESDYKDKVFKNARKLIGESDVSTQAVIECQRRKSNSADDFSEQFYKKCEELCRNRIESLREENDQNIVSLLNQDFHAFASNIIEMRPGLWDTLIRRPILHKVTNEDAISFASNLDNRDVEDLINFIEHRYDFVNEPLVEELPFWKDILEGFVGRTAKERTPTNCIIQKQVIPRIEKTIHFLESSVQNPKNPEIEG